MIRVITNITKKSKNIIKDTKIISKDGYNALTKCTGNATKRICASEVFNGSGSAYRANKGKDVFVGRKVVPRYRIAMKD
jgi:hypothetical protein